jgi:flagellar hook assembly protein FlgD/methionine-rich copper-binding protein CopC
MSKLAIVSIAFVLVFSLTASIGMADNFFAENLDVIDSAYQDTVFGGRNLSNQQQNLIISFTPGDDLTVTGDYAVIVDVDKDGDFSDEPGTSYIEKGDAVPNTAKTITWAGSSLPDGRYELAVVIDDKKNGSIDWSDGTVNRDQDTENITLDKTLSVTEVTADPITFSPNGDGIKDTTTIFYTLSESLAGAYSGVTITVGESTSGLVPAKLGAGTAAGRNSTIWDGKDGLGRNVDEGGYQVKIIAKDNGGNEVSVTTTVKVSITPPTITPTPKQDTFNATLPEVSAVLKDNSGEGIDLTQSTIRLLDPSNANVPGTQLEVGTDTIKWKLSGTLPGDGSKDGKYTIAVKAVDKIGNTQTATYTFLFDTVFPKVVSVTPADGAILTTAPASIVIVLNDGNGSGTDLATTQKSVKIDNGAIQGTRTNDGVNTITFTPSFPNQFAKGFHTIEITPDDYAGSNKTAQQFIKFQFGYFEKASDILPSVLSIIPADKSATNAYAKVSATLKDNSGKLLDLSNSTIRLEKDGVLILGTQSDDAQQTITWTLANRLPEDGSADGTYTIRVKAVDKAGGITNSVSTFLYDTTFPILTSVTPADGSVVATGLTQIVMKVSDGSGSGIDFTSSKASMTLKLGTTNITNLKSDNGIDTMTFTFPLLENGGKYSIEISLKDKAGNINPLLRKFDYVNTTSDVLPEITATDPSDKSFKNTVVKVSATLNDKSTKGLDLDASTIKLFNSSNVELAGFKTDDNNKTISWELTNPLPTDGSADGTYTIKVRAVDKAEGFRDQTYTFLYDTKVPNLTSIVPADNSVLTTGLTDIVMKVSDGSGSGIDFASSKTSMTLKVGTTTITNILKTDNGLDTITFNFPVLENTGKYSIEISLKDRAGNTNPIIKKFDYVGKSSDVLPEVTSTDPSDKSFKNIVTRIVAVLKDNSTKLLDFDLSTVRLFNPNNVLVAGFQTDDDNKTINWELNSPLPTDGSADGTYTIKIKAVDKTGATREQAFTFLYDTKVPILTSIIPADGSILTTTLTEIIAKASDGTGSGVDFAASKSSIALKVGTKTITNILKIDNGVDTMTFTFPVLEDTGKYTIELNVKDRAGNAYTYTSKFDYVGKASDVLPEVTAIDPTDKSFKNAVLKVTATLKDNSTKGLDLDASTIKLFNPANTELAGFLTNNATQTVTLELVNALPTDGSADGTYLIKVKAVDKTGANREQTFTFIYDTKVPVLTSLTPANGSVVTTALTEIVAKVNDGIGSGIDFASSRASAKLKIGTSEITMLRSDNGLDTLTFSFPALEDLGRYSFELRLKDRAGSERLITTEFDYVGKTSDVLPDIVSTDPADKSFKNAVQKITAVLKDNSGKGIDFDLSTISIIDPKNVQLAGFQTDDDSKNLTLELKSFLPTDGSADGTYTIKVKAVDKTGAIREYLSTFVYDTQIPLMASITPADSTILTKTITEIVVKVSDVNGSGVDFATSKASMKLMTGNTTITNISKQDNGIDTMTFGFAPLGDFGKYIIEINVKDRAGNNFTYQTKFDFVRKTTESLPDVSSTDPSDKSFKNLISKITAVLKDSSGKGIDFDLTTIGLSDPKGVAVDGRQTDNDSNTVNWELANPLLGDGSVDGTYTIKVKAVDNTGASYDYTATFLYDSQAPTVVKTTPSANAALSSDVTQVTVQLSDGNGSGVDLKSTDVKLQGPKSLVQANRSDGSNNTITLTFSKLTDTGYYTIQVTPKDRAGNTGYLMTAKFSYVLKAPAVKNVLLTNREYVHDLSKITAVLEDRSGVGLDLSENGSSIVVKDSTAKVLQGDQSSSGTDTIIWAPLNALAVDGTDDGIYTVTVTPIDSLGTSGQARQYTLIYDTQSPQVDSATPVDINASVTYVGQQIISVQAKIKDKGPAGLEIKDQKIYLEDSAKKQVAGVQTDNGIDTIFWGLSVPLAKDGSADGAYTLVVTAIDLAGSQKEFRYPIIYDTITPEVASVTPKDDSIVNTVLTSVTVVLKDAGKIDFQTSKIELQNPSSTKIAGTMSNNGVDKMTLTFANPEESGTYTVLITAIDKAGNGSSNVYKTRFVFKTGLPVVVSTDPITNPAESAYISKPIGEVKAVLRETDGGGIDLSPTGSEIKLKGTDGKIVIGSQTNDGSVLRYILGKSLASDGSDDGQYSILVTTANSAKRKDVEKSFTFTYDTQAPEVISASQPLSVSADLSYISTALTSVSCKLKDKGPAGVDLDKSSIKLADPNNNFIIGSVSNDDIDTLKFDFPTGLTVEGRYVLTITALDKSGNTSTTLIRFLYGVSVPKVASTVPITLPVTKAYVRTQIKEVRAVLNETGSSGIDLSSTGSTIKLVGQKGEVPGVQTSDSKTTLIFTLTKPLAIDGSDDGVYTISVTPANSAKLKGQKQDFTFTYDTVSPKISVNDIGLWYGGSAGSSLVEISAIVRDDSPSSGFDWDIVDNTWMSLRDSGGKDIKGSVSTDQTQSMLIFTLDTPLASNGKDDGYYTVTVTPKDKAGNTPDPVVRYEFFYDTKPPILSKADITINDKPLLLDSSLEEYPTAISAKNGVTIKAKMTDDGTGVDLTNSSITITDPKNNKVIGSLMQDGTETIWFTTGLLTEEGRYKVEINPVDLDLNGKSKSSETVSTEFLFEVTKPEATITEPTVGSALAESDNKAIILKGTALDKSASTSIPASGVAKVEVGGTGPDGKELEWIEAIDDEKAREPNQPEYSKWKMTFLPDLTGTYKIRLRVWDKAGNYEIYDTNLELKFTISLSFQDAVYCWPNPVTNGVAHISFSVNSPSSQKVTVTLYVYDVSGDLVYEATTEQSTKARTFIPWECRNMAGEKVVTGIYVYRLKAELPNDDQVAYKIGKPIIVKN